MTKKARKLYETQEFMKNDPDQFAYLQLMDELHSERLKKKLDEHQKAYYKGLRANRVSIVDDKSGTGKTTIAFLAAKELILDKIVSKIIYIRFPDDRAQGLGAVPGDLDEKGSIYFQPAYDALAELGIQPEAVDKLREAGVLIFRTDANLRGTNLKDAFIIIDESQNARDIGQLRLVLTRPHDDCKIALIGHSKQVDSKVKKYGKSQLTAFQVYQIHLLKKKWAKKYPLLVDYRGELSRWADEIEETLKELEEVSM
jgi:phosphate starvation-inducible PhoH-like protein